MNRAGRLGHIVFLPKQGGRQQVRMTGQALQGFIDRGGERPPLARAETAPPVRVAQGYYGPLMTERSRPSSR